MQDGERRAARLREVTAIVGDDGGDEIDIDEEEEENISVPERASITRHVQDVSEKEGPAAVFGGLTAIGN